MNSPIGMGCMRLSTDADRDEARAIAVLHAALDAGVRFFDTADAYCRDATETGHNERLIAEALRTWTGDRSQVVIATKGGLTRPQGGWVADGRARHLTAACEASRRALGVERIALYQLHAPDPRTPFATSVRALDDLKREGRIQAIGLCNVGVGQIEEARRITEIHSVQVELSVWDDGNLLNGVAKYCLENGIRLIAHRPLGGAQRQRRTASDPLLKALAERHGVTPFDIALAWLIGLSDRILPIPGPTTIEHARSLAVPYAIWFTSDDRRRLDERFGSGRLLRMRDVPGRAESLRTDGEVVLIMGLPGAGKSTAAESYVANGYARLNRDESGRTLRGLMPALDRLVESGRARIVLDNTYVSRKARAPVILSAMRHRLPVRCIWMTTGVEDAQVNVVSRMLAKYGRLLDPGEMRQISKRDPAVFPPMVLFRFQRELEPPEPSEGFSAVETIPFARKRNPALTNRGVIVWCEGVLQVSKSGARTPMSPDDVQIIEGRVSVLQRYAAEGWRICGMSWLPEIAAEKLTRAQADAIFARTQQLLGVSIDIVYCPHPAGPPVCWCRKPIPGLGVLLIDKYRLDPAQTIYVGAGPQDPTFARRLGLQYREAQDFFLGV